MEAPVIHDTASLARLFGVTKETARKWLRAGRLPGQRVGKAWFADDQQIRQRLSGRGDEPQPAAGR